MTVADKSAIRRHNGRWLILFPDGGIAMADTWARAISWATKKRLP